MANVRFWHLPLLTLPVIDGCDTAWKSYDALLADAFGRGVTGRIMGGLVGRAFGGMMKTIQQQNEAARGLQEEAAHAIKNDPEVQQQLGGSIRVGSPFSQEQSTMSINGRTTQRVSRSCIMTRWLCTRCMSLLLRPPSYFPVKVMIP
jgi:hypothetical protein